MCCSHLPGPTLLACAFDAPPLPVRPIQRSKKKRKSAAFDISCRIRRKRQRLRSNGLIESAASAIVVTSLMQAALPISPNVFVHNTRVEFRMADQTPINPCTMSLIREWLLSGFDYQYLLPSHGRFQLQPELLLQRLSATRRSRGSSSARPERTLRVAASIAELPERFEVPVVFLC